jgi:hypothetical protein
MDNTNNEELKPCPFCGGRAHIDSNRDWHRLRGEHTSKCVFDHYEEMATAPATAEGLVWLYTAWNGRAAPAPAASASIDTEELHGLLNSVWALGRQEDPDTGEVTKRIIAHIDQHVAAADRKARIDVAVALGLGDNGMHTFAWEYLLTAIEACSKGVEEQEEELERLRAAPAPVSAVPLVKALGELLGAATNEQRFKAAAGARAALTEYRASLPPSAGAPADNLQRAAGITATWPEWKRGYKLTKHSEAAGAPVSAADQGRPADAHVPRLQPRYVARSVDGKQHDTGRVERADGGFLASTYSVEEAQYIADALNFATEHRAAAQPARQQEAEQAACKVCNGIRAIAGPIGDPPSECDACSDQSPADGQELPALPHTTYNGYSDGSEPLYTADQMRDYARAAVAAAMRQPQGDEQTMRSLIEDAVANHNSPEGYIKLCMTYFRHGSLAAKQGEKGGAA